MTKKWPTLIALTLPVLITILAIWLPFGFSLIGLLEEWDVLSTFVSHGLYFIVTPDTPLGAHSLRPLTVFPHAIAYWLDPNSFDYWNILLMLALLMKGCASSHLIWKATGSLRWAQVMGVLVLVYPADTMQFSFRSFHINWALALLLLASSICVMAYENRRLITSYLLSFAAGILLFCSCCMYEAALTVALLPFLILFVRGGFWAAVHQIRTRVGHTAIWISAVLFYFLYVMIQAPKLAVSYQGSLAGNPIKSIYNNLPKLFSIGGMRSLFGCWFDAIRLVSAEFSGYLYLTVAMAAICIPFLGNKNASSSKSLPLRLAVAGLFLMLMGYLPFLLNGYFLGTSQRTFLWATPGAVIVWIALFIGISKYMKRLSMGVAVSLIFFGLGAQLFQFHHYVQRSDTQRDLLKSIVEGFDGNLDNRTLLIQDGGNQLGYTWTLPKGSLSNALSYFYNHPISSLEICRLPSSEWQCSETGTRRGICIEEEDSWILRSFESTSAQDLIVQDLKLAKNEVLPVKTSLEGIIPNQQLRDYREKLLGKKNTVGLRYCGILTKRAWPFQFTLFKEKAVQDRYRWSFGNWWGLDFPIRGTGWHGVEWTVNKLFHQSWAWQKQGKSTLYFDLTPKATPYQLRGKFTKIRDPARDCMQISINQVEIPCKWISKEEFQAEIDPQILLSGVNEIAFNAPNLPPLSVRLAWFEVYPK